MYKVKIDMPEYLEKKEFISPDMNTIANFIEAKVSELENKQSVLWSIEITPTKIQYLGFQ